MSEVISLELQFFLVSLLWGAGLLLAYDGLIIIRRFISHSAMVVAVEDVLFWSISGVLIFIMIYEQNNGTIRGFSVVAIIIGMVLYHYMISEYLVRILTTILSWFFTIIGKVFHWIFKPLRIGTRFGGKIIKKFKKTLGKRLKKTARTVKITISRK